MTDEFIFEKLNVYQKALSLSIGVCKLCSEFPIKYSRIRDQFIGAITSIPLNIAEGNGRKTSKDKINFYKIARSSSFECIPILEICFALGLTDDESRRDIREDIAEISRMLSGLIAYQKDK
jgi:four helix bundle protein